ncbi:uncharacterized protein LOC129571398, partial [Sitodiplosis mosellana]|uniref:uncharacterized protein LOC129571398 n=1 Tax=Sitodiplosis mosellana TaxID=263140 RepID=UPI0024449AA7
MTSFGATQIVNENGYNPTFKVHGQVYHLLGSLLPVPDEDSKFLQIYFIGDNEKEINQRCTFHQAIERAIISDLQELLHQHNRLIKIFKYALHKMPSKDYQVVIHADKTPAGEHERRFNAPIAEEVAIVIVGSEFERRDIVVQKQDSSLQRVPETHRMYDALQYPLIHWDGRDEYHIQIMQIDPENDEPTTKKVSSNAFYAYRIMIRANESNHILKCGKLFQQYLVDMYTKFESERLLFIRLNQKKLRAENYIHLRDAITNDGNVADIGQMVILPSTHTGSPRHMHEYAQDAMTYVRKFGKPDLFITFTCNPKWSEIQELLLPGQTTADRPDIVARVFQQKLQCFMKLIVKSLLFGDVRYNIISAEIPDPNLDPILHEIIKKHMIHGPCGKCNPKSPCMRDNKCTKNYSRPFVQETQTGGDGYPLYRRRKPDDGGHTFTMKAKGVDMTIDNRWAIKYILKYIHKGSDMAVIGLMNNISHDEVTQYQTGRYISSHEAVWRILGFNIHERFPAVVQLTVHLENGQR